MSGSDGTVAEESISLLGDDVDKMDTIFSVAA